jgi:hypothetical protein
VSQDSAQEFFERSFSPNHDGSRIEFQFFCLWIRFVSQGVFVFIVLVLEVTGLLR